MKLGVGYFHLDAELCAIDKRWSLATAKTSLLSPD